MERNEKNAIKNAKNELRKKRTFSRDIKIEWEERRKIKIKKQPLNKNLSHVYMHVHKKWSETGYNVISELGKISCVLLSFLFFSLASYFSNPQQFLSRVVLFFCVLLCTKSFLSYATVTHADYSW